MSTEKPFRTSNYVGGNIQDIKDYVRNVNRDIQSICTYLNTFPRVYQQTAEPGLSTDSMAFWKNTGNSKYYLLLNISGTQKKVELV